MQKFVKFFFKKNDYFLELKPKNLFFLKFLNFVAVVSLLGKKFFLHQDVAYEI